MRVSVTLEYRFSRTPDGRTWTQTTFPYEFWKRYLEVFSEVNVIARADTLEAVDDSWKQVDGPGVVFSPMPYYIGPVQYLKCRSRLREAVRQAIRPDDAMIFRLSSSIAAQVLPEFIKAKRPYGVEIVADPYDVFAPGANSHPARAFFRWLFPRRLREECRHASSLSAVTKSALQRRYPPAEGAFTTYYSDVDLLDHHYIDARRVFTTEKKCYTLVMVGGLSQLYKAPHILIDAVSIAVSQGADVKLKIIGDGRCRPQLEDQVQELGLESRISFLGQLPGLEAVSAELDSSDIFVLPSFQEGLPRATVEAMARALPVIGSTVGGFPELLETDEMVAPGCATSLANKIVDYVSDPERLTAISERNLEKARDYHEDRLCERRNAFFNSVRQQTEHWLEQSSQVDPTAPGSNVSQQISA